MDIDILSGLIRDIIMERDSVTLPSLGVFYAEMVGASFSDKGFSINPPYRKLSFRQRDEDEDNAIVRLYAQRCSEGLSQDETEGKRADVEREIAEFMEGLREVLLREKMVIFPGLGRLRATKENHVFFVPDEDLDIFPEGFGLEKLSLKSLAAEGTVITPIPVKGRSAEPGADSPAEVNAADNTATAAATEAPATPPAAEKAATTEAIAAAAPVAAAATEAPATPAAAEKAATTEAIAAEAPVAAAAAEAPATPAAAEKAATTEAIAAAPVTAAATAAPVAAAAGKRKPLLVTAIVATLSAAAAAAAALAILGRTCPQIIDPLLYTPEEIAIINHPDA